MQGYRKDLQFMEEITFYLIDMENSAGIVKKKFYLQLTEPYMKNELDSAVRIDITNIPKGISIPQVVEIMREHGIIFWDSRLGGLPPSVVFDEDDKVKIMDINEPDGKVAYDAYIKYGYLYKIVKSRLMTRIKKNFLSLCKKHTHDDNNSV
jgi:hypothetical protein